MGITNWLLRTTRVGRALAVVGFAALTLLTADSSHAAPFLMTTDGVSGDNISRATALGETVTTTTLSTISVSTPSSLSPYSVIWVSPDLDTSYTSLRTAVALNGSLERYVFNGGRLVLNVAGNAGNQADIAPGGIDYDRSTIHNAETFTTPAHPYLTGVGYGGAALTPSDFDTWSFTDHGIFQNLLPGTITVLSNANGPSWVEYPYGAGRVLLTTLTYGWGSNGARLAPRDNLILYPVVLPEPAAGLTMLSLAATGLLARRRRAA
jgi:hypothetical protein